MKIRPSCLEAPCPDRRPAFTLIELLAVMGTMGIVLLLATATLVGASASTPRPRRSPSGSPFKQRLPINSVKTWPVPPPRPTHSKNYARAPPALSCRRRAVVASSTAGKTVNSSELNFSDTSNPVSECR